MNGQALRADPEISSRMVEIRRRLHEFPELGFSEHKTSELICRELERLGIRYKKGIAGTGVIGETGNAAPDKRCVALRADMDALPIKEKTGLAFASQNPGIMHACGHDGHVAMLLGAAALLQRAGPCGRVRLLFQPAEESTGGAKRMIEGGALSGVDAIFGGHIDRHFDVGQIAVQPGIICAYADTFSIDINGRGGHAARPHETVDSIVVASLLVMSIQTLVSREINPAYPSVVTVGSIKGGHAANVIADKAHLEGTIRTTHAEVREKLISGLERMVKATGELYHARTSISFTQGYPPVINHEDAAETARQAALRVVGKQGVVRQAHPSLGGEDFAYYLREIPGCFVRFGASKKGWESAPAHSSRFDFDEGVLPIGAAFLATVVMMYLRNDFYSE